MREEKDSCVRRDAADRGTGQKLPVHAGHPQNQ